MHAVRLAARPAIVLCASLLAPAAAVAQQVDLRPKFEKGDENRFVMTQDSTIKSPDPMGGGESEQKVGQEIGLLLRVTESGEEGATTDMVFESFKMSIPTPFGSMEFDSSKPASEDAENPLAGMLRPIVGTTLVVKFDAGGNITSVTGGEQLLNGPMGGQFTQIIGEKAVKSNFGPIFSIKKGAGKVSVGEKWQNVDVLEESPIGKFQMTMDHTLESVRNGNANVGVKGKVEFLPVSPGAEAPVKIKDSNVSGRYEWDTEDGMLEKMEFTQQLVLEEGQGAAAQTINSTSVVKIARKK